MYLDIKLYLKNVSFCQLLLLNAYLFPSIPNLRRPDFSGVLGVVLVLELNRVPGIRGTEINGRHQ